MATSPEKSMSTAILPLSPDAILQIKSSTTVTSLNGVVFGLLENSLDAQASRIEISVNFSRGVCSIEDDGLGIPPAEFREGGGLGRMYHTSKHGGVPWEVHGGEGTFLASVAALSQMTITSRHYQHFSHNTLTIHRSKPISRLTPAPAQHEVRNRTSHGTRVTVRDLFGNIPVRVKQRAMTTEDTPEVERQWQALKKGLVALLLPWRNRVILKVSDADIPSRSFSINTIAQISPNALSERNLNVLNKRTPSLDPTTVLGILAQSGFTSVESKHSWIPVSAATLSVSVKGLISLDPAPSKTAQFISIGINPCLDENRHNELYDTVNRIFDQSSFGYIDDGSEPDEAELERRKYDRRYKNDGPTNKQIRGGRKGVDRWPRFYVRIELLHGAEQPVNKLSDMRLRSIIHILEALITQWLEANHFRSRSKKRKRKGTNEREQIFKSGLNAPSVPPTPHGESTPNVRSGSETGFSDERMRSSREMGRGSNLIPAIKPPFTDWSRIKSAKPQMYENIWHCNSPLTKGVDDDMAGIVGEERPVSTSADTSRFNVEEVSAGQFGTDIAASHDDCTCAAGTIMNTITDVAPSVHSVNSGTDGVIEWVNPATKERYRINARTGMVMADIPRRPASEDPSVYRSAAAANPQTSSLGKPLGLRRRQSAPPDSGAAATPWLQGLLQEWKNPIYANQSEQRIPVAGFGGPGQGVRGSGRLDKQTQIANSFLQSGTADMSRLSKSALTHAQVISQVDQKFILMKMPSTRGSNSAELDFKRQLLVLMDQHAASERCLLETLLAELCTPEPESHALKSNLGQTSSILTVNLGEPLCFQMPAQEDAMFRAQAAHFANWGILYDIRHTRLSVLTLPPGISARCVSSPKLLMELLRTEIYALAETPNSSQRNIPEFNSSDRKHPWLRRLGSCPKGIIQLLNSRACRSAIMFNDALNLEECKALVEGLKDCVFPFMCAHGRNSMVPLVYLGGNEDSEGIGRGNMVSEEAFGGSAEEKGGEGFADAYRKWRGEVKA